MAEPKTKLTEQPVADFLNGIPDEDRRKDCWRLVEILEEAAKAPAKMWGSAIVGFGQYRAVNASGKGNDWLVIGFSPRKQALTLYLHLGGMDETEPMLARLGKYSRGKGCLYIQRLAEVDESVLAELARASVDYVTKEYGA
jgi:hypothetical protein